MTDTHNPKTAKMTQSEKVVQKLVDLEERFKLLSGDAIWQKDLTIVQAELTQLMLDISSISAQQKLTKKLPYLFYMEVKP